MSNTSAYETKFQGMITMTRVSLDVHLTRTCREAFETEESKVYLHHRLPQEDSY
jgi:hypothetical protein